MATTVPRFDVIVVGSGHNGLICAAYLSWAGLDVLVVEANEELGGGATTAEVTLPGFRHNLHANFHVGVVDSPWLRDLELHRYGHSYIVPPVQHALSFPDGTCVCLHSDADRSERSIARFSRRDAAAFAEVFDLLSRRLRPLLVRMLYSSPRPPSVLSEWLRESGGGLIADLSQMTMDEAVDAVFEHPKVRNLFKLILATMTVENTPRSGLYLPLAISAIGRMALATGGSIQLPRALARRLRAYGGQLRLGSPVREIRVVDGEAQGVVLEDGQTIAATTIVSAIDFPQTVELAGESWFGENVRERARGWRWGARTLCSLHVALREPPLYRSADFDPDVNEAFSVYIGPESERRLTENLAEVDSGAIPTDPMGNGACDSYFDPTYAPANRHSAFWWPWGAYELADGGPERWDALRGEYTDYLLERWRSHAPNLTPDNVLATYLFTPLDIARSNRNMVRGAMRGGAYYPEQMGYLRPDAAMSDGRSPVHGLYLCGSSVGYGGGIGGAPGYSVAGVIADDLGLPVPWEPVPAPGR